MNMAMFLDVDKTLTRDFIQKGYAKSLGCEDAYTDIERRFQEKQITSSEFGEELIAAFAKKGFTQLQSRKLFDGVSLQRWADELLKMTSIEKYLVSSGPSYYIDLLAEKHGIPGDHVCRSLYKFNDNTGIIESCSAIDDQQKVFFVKDKVGSYDLTIGIGDSPEHDAFVSHCSIPILTTVSDGFIHAPNFGTVMRLVRVLESAGAAPLSQEDALHADELSIPQLFRRLSVSSWVVLSGAVAGAFGLGTALGRAF